MTWLELLDRTRRKRGDERAGPEHEDPQDCNDAHETGVLAFVELTGTELVLLLLGDFAGSQTGSRR
jgi:hypothetical protein